MSQPQQQMLTPYVVSIYCDYGYIACVWVLVEIVDSVYKMNQIDKQLRCLPLFSNTSSKILSTENLFITLNERM